MKKLTLNIEDNKYGFFLELIKNLDFIEIKDDVDTKEDIKKNLINGLTELNEYKKGNLKTTKANDLLDEL